jgi:hypothetical protein
MKTQRRHELQTNELADHLGRYLQTIRPYQNVILTGVVAVIVIVVGVMWFSNQRAAKAAASWSDYYGAMAEQRPEALEDMAQFHSGTTAALWAWQAAGDMNLANGAGLMFQDRDEAETKLKDAEKNFKAVEQGAAKYPDLLRRARFGLAQVYETLCDVSKAQDYYQQVAQSAPDSALGKLAADRLDRLTDPSMEKWYNWFERQEPAPPAPVGGLEQNPLGDLEDLPELPDLSFPGDTDTPDMPAPDQSQAPAEETQTPAGPELAPADQPAAAEKSDESDESDQSDQSDASDESEQSDQSDASDGADASDGSGQP